VALGRRHPSLAVAQLDLPCDPDFARKAGRVLELYHRKGIPPAASSLLLMTLCTCPNVHQGGSTKYSLDYHGRIYNETLTFTSKLSPVLVAECRFL
jgi:hypothetical protein